MWCFQPPPAPAGSFLPLRFLVLLRVPQPPALFATCPPLTGSSVALGQQRGPLPGLGALAALRIAQPGLPVSRLVLLAAGAGGGACAVQLLSLSVGLLEPVASAQHHCPKPFSHDLHCPFSGNPVPGLPGPVHGCWPGPPGSSHAGISADLLCCSQEPTLLCPATALPPQTHTTAHGLALYPGSRAQRPLVLPPALRDFSAAEGFPPAKAAPTRRGHRPAARLRAPWDFPPVLWPTLQHLLSLLLDLQPAPTITTCSRRPCAHVGSCVTSVFVLHSYGLPSPRSLVSF